MKKNMIEIEVSWNDYKKIMSLDEFDIERKILQTSAAQYIHISLQPERSKREDQSCRFCLDPNSILTKETCCTGCGALNSMET